MKHLLHALAICGGIAVGGHAAAQEPPPPPPPAQDPPATFRTTVDLVAVDVNIIDKTGKPIGDLESDDFVLMVDGKPRRVVSIQYVPSVRASASNEPLPEHYSSNDRSSGGRMIMLVVDQGNIGSGRGRVALNAASKFIEQLSPADRVGLATLPGAGPQIDFTEHHALVRTMLGKIVGQNSSFQGLHRMGLSEAAEIHRGNPMMHAEVTDRECTGKIGMELMLCRRQVETEARTLYTLARQRSRSSLMALKHLLDRLALTPSQKSLIYISEGLFVDRELSELAWVTEAAMRAQAVLYILQLQSASFEAEIARPSPTMTQDRLMDEEGLGMLAGYTRGALLRVGGNAESAFNRLALELSGYYLLSFEPEPGDRDGKPHRIEVDVPGRDNVAVRARAEFIIGEPRIRSAESLLEETMRAPLLASDLPLKLAAYTLRDPGQDTLRILLSAEIDRSVNPRERISLAYVLLDAKGAVVSSRLVKDVESPVPGPGRSQSFVASMPAGPAGMYTLKLAVVDENGRRGSVEHTFNARLTNAGQLRVTDLMIGERIDPRGQGVSPAVTGAMSADLLHGYIELYGDSEDLLDKASVTIEVASSPDGTALDAAPARLMRIADVPNRRSAEGVVPIALLPPGEYVARAVIRVGDDPVGLVHRPFHVPKDRAVRMSSPLDAAPGARPPIPFVSRPDAFERSSVLTPPVVGFFLERMDFGPSGATGGAAAVDHARAGRFEEAIAALAAAENRQLATAFLTGLSLYSKGDLEGAAGKFRDSLRLDSEFFPAAFYLGACYAAGGRDDQAVGAWQTSLVTESDAPFIYTLLADAYLRLRELPSAFDILTEAQTLWPDRDPVQLRLGTVLALQGRGPEALAVLEPYLLRNPDDYERHFVILRMLYEAKQAGRPVKSQGEDRVLFESHAERYKAAGGPQAALVEEWRRVVAK